MNSEAIVKALAILSVLLFCLVWNPPVEACHKGKPHGPQTSCDDDPPPPPDGGDDPPTPVDTYAWWPDGEAVSGNAVQDENWGRECTPENFQPGGSAGHYHCRHVAEYWNLPLHFDFLGVTDYEQTRRNGDPLLCETFRQGMSLIADGLYNYYWEGNCKAAGGCLIRIIHWFNGQQVMDAVEQAVPGSPAIDRIVLNGLVQLTLGSQEDANPFAVERVLEVETITAEFYAAGKNKSEARCAYYMDGIPAVFQSVPR